MMVETAIVMPLYLIVVFALLFFGYSTLARQKMQQAAAYAAWHTETQGAGELMDRFFPWNPDAQEQSTPGGSEAEAGEATLELTDQVLPGGGYELDAVTERLWVLSLGEVIQDFVWEDGHLVERMRQVGDDASRYLNDNDITVQSGPHTATKYTRWVTEVLDGDGSSTWVERRRADLNYTFAPHYLGVAVADEGESLTSSQFLSMQMPRPTWVPMYPGSFSVTGRGELERQGAAGTTEMARLVGSGLSMPAPMSDATLNTLKEAYWPGGPALWEPR